MIHSFLSQCHVAINEMNKHKFHRQYLLFLIAFCFKMWTERLWNKTLVFKKFEQEKINKKLSQNQTQKKIVSEIILQIVRAYLKI